MIRKAVYGRADMSNTDDSMGIEHIDHCIDMLRQSIMVGIPHSVAHSAEAIFTELAVQ